MRRYARHPADIPIDVQVNNIASPHKPESCMTTVSMGGLSCEVGFCVSVGCKVSIDIPSISPPYHGVGQVVWCREKGDHYELGVQFNDKQEAYKSRMVQQICQIEDYKNQVYKNEGRKLDGNEAAAEWIAKHAKDFPL